ncbi:hypothetical protein OOZ51_00350 [Arthrobacter sp. MI7-26]|uniref:hypothetical protein n=1 Tax=Arthrobacter sp. MI7-26 TaxID=2993653 RepID=UPI00224949B5|nr:hypothetical protein [Arthrobacter sp. MI7-26]MCX2746263.1 hypothetical protein [Arthrobacter sp. MI7-26]
MSINRPEQHTSVTPDALPQHIQRVDEAFDKTSLGEAHSEGLLDNQIPDHAQDVIDRAAPDDANFLEHPVRPKVTPKRARNLLVGAGAVVATGLIATGAFLGIRAGTEGQHSAGPSPSPDNTSSAPVTPGETAAPTPEALTVASLEISANNTPEKIGELIVQDRLSKWVMAGATPENQRAWLDSGGSYDVIKAIAEKNGDTIADALLVPNWRDIPALVKFVNNEKEINAHNLEFWMKTYKSQNPADQEAFTNSISAALVTLESQTATGQTISVVGQEHNNAKKNRGETWEPGLLKDNESTFTFHLTIETDNNRIKVSDIR